MIRMETDIPARSGILRQSREAYMKTPKSSVLFAALSILTALPLMLLQPACDNNKPVSSNPGDTISAQPLVPYNPHPVDGAVDVSDYCTISWQCDNPDEDTISYYVYFGIDSLIPILRYYPAKGYAIPWGKQSKAQRMLIQIYQMEFAYRSRLGYLCLDGIAASRTNPTAFEGIGVIIDSDDYYTYGISCGYYPFSCTATANLDNDGTFDCWRINQTGALEQTISDFTDHSPIEFRPGTTYSWQVRVIDNHNDTTSGPIWHFTTSDSMIPVYDIGFPHFPMPEDYSDGVACSTIFQWYCAMGAGDSLTYDLYLSPGDGAPQPRIMNLAINRAYPGWARQWKVQRKLWKIYVGEQFFKEYGYGGCYVLNGVSAFYGHNYFHMIGVEMEEDDIYTYTISASCDTFVCTAVANIDTDPTIDTWTVDQTGTIRHPIEDSDLPFTPGQSYSWKIIAHDTHGDLYEGPVWHFTTGE